MQKGFGIKTLRGHKTGEDPGAALEYSEGITY